MSSGLFSRVVQGLCRNSKPVRQSVKQDSVTVTCSGGGGTSRSFASGPTTTDYNFLETKTNDITPTKCDVCIIGGGVMGLSTAYWLKSHNAGKDMKVVVLERDSKYTKASSVLSMGGIRQQFSLQENIELSLFGAEFLRRSDEFFGIRDQQNSVQYHPCGYLFLTTTADGAELLHDNWTLQKKLGSKVELLSRQKLQEKFPFFNVEDVQLGSFGLDNEGWFDPWSLLNGFKRKALSLGVNYIHGEVCDFDYKIQPGDPVRGPNSIIYKTADGNPRTLEFEHCVVAAGYDSGRVAALAGIGTGQGILSHPLPVEPKKRYVYFVHSPNAPDKGFPMLIDSTGTYARREGSPGHFLCGLSPEEVDEPPVDNLDVDYSFFDSHVWPNLAHRVPSMENLKVKSGWGGYYDYNTFDQNGIIGTHPAFTNFHFATGFSGHGIQQSPAVGRAIMELILYGKFSTIDLGRFGFDRFIEGRQVLEQNIV